MRPDRVVLFYEHPDTLPCIHHRFIVVHVHFINLQCPPESFDRLVVQGPQLSGHADSGMPVLEHRDVVAAHILGAVVTVDDIRIPIFVGSFFKSFQDEETVQGVAQPPAEDPFAEPVHEHR